MTVLSYRDGIAIGEIIIYVPALLIAILLTIRHGFGRSSGWVFLIFFTLVRIVGACFQLAIINDPTNISLYIGAAILTTVGISPLELCALGLLSRVVSSIDRSGSSIVKPHHMKIGQLVVTVGFILAIIGGTSSTGSSSTTLVVTPQPLSRVGLGLFIAGFVIIAGATILASFTVSHAEPGEKRLLVAVALSLPFILIRLIYSSIYLFGTNYDFSPLSGSVTTFLCMALIMELCAVIIFESVGLTLQRAPPALGPTRQGEDTSYSPGSQPSKGSQFVETLGRRTIIGRLLTRLSGNGNNVQMQQRGGRKGRRAARRGQNAGY